MTFRTIFLRGVSWTSTSTITNSIIQFLVILLLANYLTPEELGAVSLYLMLMNFLAMLSEFGFSSALVQNPRVNIVHFSSVLIGSVFWGLLLALLFYLFSEEINILFIKIKNDELIRGLKYLSITIFLTSLLQVARAFLVKRLKFKILAKIEVISSLVFLFLNVLFIVWLNFGIFGFVYSLIAKRIIESFFYLIKAKIPFKLFDFRINHFKELAYFGVNATADRLITFIANNVLINLVIGRNFGLESLGQYNLAYQILYYPQQRLSSVISTVSFPTFSFYQKNKDEMRNGYLKILKYLSYIIFPINIFAFFLGPDIINMLYGHKYELAKIIIKILALGGIFKFIVTQVGPLIYSKGRADIGFAFNLINFILTFLILEYSKSYGIIYAISLWISLTIILNIFIQLIGNRLIHIKTTEFIYNFKTSIISSFLMLFFIILSIKMLDFVHISNFIRILTTLLIGSFVFIISLYKFEDEWRILIKAIFKK